jgi:putative nucleotidyltransferase with HDIG domain
MTGRVTIAGHGLLLAAAIIAACVTSRSTDWQPTNLLVLLTALAVVSDAFPIAARGMRLTGSFVALVLAMALLGPAPAAAIGIVAICVDTLRSPPSSAVLTLSNFSTYAAFPLIGGLLVRWAKGFDDRGTVEFGLIVLAVFLVTNLLNFGLIAVNQRLVLGRSLREQVRSILLPVLPAEAVAAMLAVVIAVTYDSVGFVGLLALVIVLVIFQVLTRELLLSQERAEQLSSLQVGVLAALVQTLSLRDKMTARHSAAVARFARAIAEADGCTRGEQELVHTAGLLHDIGKFIFPDRILVANSKLSDEDWEIVKLHPSQGALLVQRVNGYGPVADIILAHHEKVDGTGYPHGLRGDQVPLLSRMIAIADTYDVMTARDSYRRPVSREEAIAELRRVSGTQLDPRLVELFVVVLSERGLAFQHTTDADFEAELDFEKRVRTHARPVAA